jgi:hypothetical protein
VFLRTECSTVEFCHNPVSLLGSHAHIPGRWTSISVYKITCSLPISKLLLNQLNRRGLSDMGHGHISVCEGSSWRPLQWLPKQINVMSGWMSFATHIPVKHHILLWISCFKLITTLASNIFGSVILEFFSRGWFWLEILKVRAACGLSSSGPVHEPVTWPCVW